MNEYTEKLSKRLHHEASAHGYLGGFAVVAVELDALRQATERVEATVQGGLSLEDETLERLDKLESLFKNFRRTTARRLSKLDAEPPEKSEALVEDQPSSDLAHKLALVCKHRDELEEQAAAWGERELELEAANAQMHGALDRVISERNDLRDAGDPLDNLQRTLKHALPALHKIHAHSTALFMHHVEGLAEGLRKLQPKPTVKSECSGDTPQTLHYRYEKHAALRDLRRALNRATPYLCDSVLDDALRVLGELGGPL